jgi:hypothetical protein
LDCYSFAYTFRSIFWKSFVWFEMVAKIAVVLTRKSVYIRAS